MRHDLPYSARISEFKTVSQFVDGFLEESEGTDVWRSLHPQSSGFIYKSDSGLSHSRLDYFLISPLILNAAQGLKMRIATWLPKQDHARISISLHLPALISGCLLEIPGRFHNL